MLKIKTCGLFRHEDIEYANMLLPDYIGFVFAKSKRMVTPEQASILKSKLNKKILSVGVFVNAPPDDTIALHRRGIIDLIQLHGDEDNEYIRYIKKKSNAPIIKAVKIKCRDDITPANSFLCDYLLLDSGSGSGIPFDWSLIDNIQKPWFLAGGINTQNIKDAARYAPYGIDVSSGIETDGVKDFEKMRIICEYIKKRL